MVSLMEKEYPRVHSFVVDFCANLAAYKGIALDREGAPLGTFFASPELPRILDACSTLFPSCPVKNLQYFIGSDGESRFYVELKQVICMQRPELLGKPAVDQLKALGLYFLFIRGSTPYPIPSTFAEVPNEPATPPFLAHLDAARGKQRPR